MRQLPIECKWKCMCQQARMFLGLGFGIGGCLRSVVFVCSLQRGNLCLGSSYVAAWHASVALSPLEVDTFSWFLIRLWRWQIGYLSQHFEIFETEKHVQRCIQFTILGFEMEVFQIIRLLLVGFLKWISSCTYNSHLKMCIGIRNHLRSVVERGTSIKGKAHFDSPKFNKSTHLLLGHTMGNIILWKFGIS